MHLQALLHSLAHTFAEVLHLLCICTGKGVKTVKHNYFVNTKNLELRNIVHKGTNFNHILSYITNITGVDTLVSVGQLSVVPVHSNTNVVCVFFPGTTAKCQKNKNMLYVKKRRLSYTWEDCSMWAHGIVDGVRRISGQTRIGWKLWCC